MNLLLFLTMVLLGSNLVAEDTVDTHTWTCQEVAKHGKTPKYSVQRQVYAGKDPVELYLQISLDSEVFLSEATITLVGCKLALDYPKVKIIYALLFDDERAAKQLALHATDQTNYGQYLWHLRGKCEVNRLKPEQYVEFLFPEARDGMMVPSRIKVQFSEKPR